MTTLKLKEDTVIFEQAITGMAEILQSTPTELLFKKPSEQEWSAMQIASHIVEAIEFWIADLEALLIVPGAKWGRNHEHVRRLAAVEETYVSSLKVDEVVAALQQLIPLTNNSLQKVTDADLVKTAPSYNPNFDGKPLAFLVDHLIIKHANSHLGQMQRHLEKVQA